MSATTKAKLEFTHALYECGICSCYHPWNWDADCRDDANRVFFMVRLRSMPPGIVSALMM
jgi:hypothetical protein